MSQPNRFMATSRARRLGLAASRSRYHGRVRHMRPLLRKAPGLFPALLAFAILGAFCPKDARRAAAPPAGEPELKLAPLSAQLSEPSGYFDSDNLISNETS